MALFLPNNQSVSVFHQHMPRVTQLRFFLSALLRQSRIPIRRRFIRRVGPLLPVNLHREVATGGSLFPSLRWKLVVPAQASNSVSSTVKCSSLRKCFSRILQISRTDAPAFPYHLHESFFSSLLRTKRLNTTTRLTCESILLPQFAGLSNAPNGRPKIGGDISPSPSLE